MSDTREASKTRRRRRCTMIGATILLCYLFTCCTHLTQLTQAATSAAASSSSQAKDQHTQDHLNHLHPTLGGGMAGGGGGGGPGEPAPGGLSGRLALGKGENGENNGAKHWKNNQHDLEDLSRHTDTVHKLMSEQDLRRTFQVDSHDQVPEYEVLKLQVNDHQDGLNEIVMKLSTFGKDFKLRLKRNVDFQQRIKDMKMFMAESTEDGQLRYTEIKSHQAHRQQESQRRATPTAQPSVDAQKAAGQAAQAPGTGGGVEASPSMWPSPPPKSSAAGSSQPSQAPAKSGPHLGAAESGSGTAAATSSNDATSKNSKPHTKQPPLGESLKIKLEAADGASGAHLGSSAPHTQPASNVWNIGSTYHDEDNLAALLIDHDKRTGQLQVDGTIGNDFVIKPMPQATIDALLLKRQQELLKSQQAAVAAEQLAAAANSRLDRLTSVANSNNNNATADLERGQRSATGATGGQLAGQDLERAMHMHDDDPHDDDEMFLDEDEAIELAHLQSSTLQVDAGAHSANNKTHQPAARNNNNNKQHLPQQHSRALSKAASERKWKKYRKLMAQTQVPKPGALAASGEHQNQRHQQQQSSSSSSTSSTSSARARRHAHVDSAGASGRGQHRQEPKLNENENYDNKATTIHTAHHIIYRQRPSSEASSSEHQHSFMLAPGQYSAEASNMERLAISFAPQRLTKRAATTGRGEAASPSAAAASSGSNMIDELVGESSGNREHAQGPAGDEEAAELDQATDNLHDPLGGQFYLEPGSFTGLNRAGYSDWSLMARHSGMAPPPYALNGTSSGASSAAHLHHADHYHQWRQLNASLAGAGERNETRGRFKRHARGDPKQQQQVRKKRQAPDTVWPEVLLVVDYDSFLLHGGDSRDVKRYFVSFWNGVDLRYKLLVHPHIRISLAGMIVAKDRDATPYLERNRLRAPNADAVDAAGALTDMGKYLYREDRLPTYDLAVVITKLDMCRRRYEGGRCNRGTAGFAYVGGACVVNKRLEKVNSVAIIEDSGGFSGIIVAAHEVGHLLGCVHDGSPPPSYLGGPGATHCPWEDGFIMSDLRHTERGFRWSQCSVEQFKHFLNGETATCLYNYPHESQMLHRLLPGTMLSLDEQCKRDRGTNACFKDARVCAQLFCFDSASGYCVSYRPAAEGSPCGEGQVCRNGKCVGEIENIIPDYTHQSQTVVARRPGGGGGNGGPGHSAVSARLADNGISASLTSTATSSPDSKLSAASTQALMAGPGQSSAAQLTSRMDTFPIDTPLSGGQATTGAYSYDGRTYAGNLIGGPTLDALGVTNAGLGLNKQLSRAGSHSSSSSNNSPNYHSHHHNLQIHHHSTGGKSAKLVDHNAANQQFSNNNNNNNSNKQSYLQRSGHQALPKSGANQSAAKQQYQKYQANIHKQQNQHPQSSSAALYTSASTNTHHLHPYYPAAISSTPGNHNLLTSSSSSPPTASTNSGIVANNRKQTNFHDNQRSTYQQQQPIRQFNVDSRTHVIHHHHHFTTGPSTNSSKLYNNIPLSQQQLLIAS